MKIKAYAKINLFLDILGKRSDGYHFVDMIMQSIDLHDVLDVTLTKTKKIELESSYKFEESIEKNTAYIVAKKFFQFADIQNPGLKIFIKKNIPVCAGLAGGSSDAAATLVCLDKMFGTKLSQTELLQIAAQIGADVPFCISGGTVHATGIGTDLVSLSNLPDCYIVVVKPDFGVCTQKAYSKSDSLTVNSRPNISKVIQSICDGNLKLVCDNLYNRFEHVIDVPEIKNIKKQLIAHGCLNTVLSGSGPSVFGIFENFDSANKSVLFFKKIFKQTFLCSPTNYSNQLLGNLNSI